MDTSGIKNIFSKLTVIKNYSAFVLPIVVLVFALILIVASWWLSGRLRADMKKKSISLAKSIDRLESQRVSSQQWKIEKVYQDALQNDANEIAQMAGHTNQRELLSYEIFPEPKDTSVLIFKRFGQNYRKAAEDIIGKYNGKRCPTDLEIDKALEMVTSDTSRSRVSSNQMMRPMGRISKSSKRSGARSQAEEWIVDEMCKTAAQNTSFYVDVTDIAGYAFWGEPEEGGVHSSGRGSGTTSTVYEYQSIRQSVADCWFWQLGYWIIDDVFETINQMNSDGSSVLDCPVKKLVEIDFGSSRRGRSTSEGSFSRPDYVHDSKTSIVNPYTRRFSNDDWDVVHFRVVLLVDARYTLGFMQQLCSVKPHTFRGWFGNEPAKTFKHNQITVLESVMDPVDTEDTEHELYRYGDAPVVSIELTCEYIFERAGYKLELADDQEGSIVPDFIGNPDAESNN